MNTYQEYLKMPLAMTFDEMDNDEYYLVTVSANIALRNLRLTYAPVGESAQVAAGMLQAGDQAEI